MHSQIIKVKRFRLLIFFLITVCSKTFSQNNSDTLPALSIDTVIVSDTVKLTDPPGIVSYFKDSVSENPFLSKDWVFDKEQNFLNQWVEKNYKLHPYFNFSPANTRKSSDLKKFEGKEDLFYAITGLLLLFGFFKLSFSKYLNDLFRLFFRTTLRYRQISEQLLLNPMPSMLLNLFFVITAAFYASTLLFYFKRSPLDNFWLLFVYGFIILASVYLVKYLGLKFSGWLFSVSEATDAYIFIVFIVNKIMAIYLLPFLVIISFSVGNLQQVAVTLSWVGVAGLLLHRFILSYGSIRNLLNVNPFHFFLYLCAFEVVPLLIIYKMLLLFL